MDSAMSIFTGILGLGLIILLLVSYYKIFEKMGEEGWKGLVPVYNMYIIAEKVGKPGYWGILTILPYIGIIWAIWLLNLMFKRFGKDQTYTVLTIFFGYITIPMLAFGDAKWQGDSSDEIEEIGNTQ